MRRSYSYMPTDRMPVTSNARIRGITPSGVTSPRATSSTTRSPTFAPSSSARALPRMTRYLPGCQISQPGRSAGAVANRRRAAPRPAICRAAERPTTCRRGSTCPALRYTAPRRRRPGSAGVFRDPAASSGSAPRDPRWWREPVRLRMRVRSTSSKPFMTDSTTISTATPSAKPSIAMPAISDTNRAAAMRADSAIR